MRRVLVAASIFILTSIAFAQTSPHGDKLKMDCVYCHTTNNWTTMARDMKFNHDETSFKLLGQHANVDCKSCHESLIFSDAKNDCNSCHKDVHQNTLGTDCAECHTPNTWVIADARQMHDKTRFPLVGVHQNLDCASCHTGYLKSYFPPLDVSCFSCHSQQYYATTSPNHVQAQFSTQCQDCHGVVDVSWGPTNFNHSFFPLTGGHAIQNCYACHAQGNKNFSGLSTNCYGCHQADFAHTTFPNHASLNLSINCQTCHTINSWTPATFDHSTTGFALTGSHASANCASCHKTATAVLPTDCYSCHSADFASATNPNHITGGFPHQCDQCHSTTNWNGATFDHSTTGFPLTGEHANLQCAQCHSSGYTSTPSDCYSCHTTDYTNAVTPVNHVAAGLPHTCQDCHTTMALFTTSTFNHANTGFALTGAHTTTTCESCHKGSVSGAPTDCYSCHSTDFANTTDPNHVTGGFPHDCSQCHSTTSWSGSSFDHTTTGFPLTLGHANLQCIQCHASGYTNTSPACVSCHQSNYNSTTNPSHTILALPSDCTTCHTTNPGWTPATFPIHSNYYVITGAHTSLTCDQCHNGNYNVAPTSCYGCHQNDYNSTSNPPHQAAGYPTDCTQCHTQTAWSPSTFNHSQFPITAGNHASPPLLCSQCHTTISNFAIFSCTTSGCHPEASTDPHHTGVRNYVYSPTSCYSCHANGGGD